MSKDGECEKCGHGVFRTGQIPWDICFQCQSATTEDPETVAIHSGKQVSRKAEPNIVYVVCGTAGCYSSRTNWLVRAFLTKEPAEALMERLRAWCKETGADSPGKRLSEREHDEHMRLAREARQRGDTETEAKEYTLAEKAKPHPLEDPGFQNWGDAEYYVEEVPLSEPVKP